ncbi:sarcosine oxidase subunit gamma [Roseivivax sp. CAU 1753]
MTQHGQSPNLSPDLTPGPLAKTGAARVDLIAPVGRFSLRARADAIAALSAALGFDLPARIGTRTASEGTEALCLGPDEWLILAAEDAGAGIVAAFAAVYADTPHALTEITDREVTFRLGGPQAAELLTLGMPRDVDSIATGAARRTLFDGATVVLWRDGEQDFRMDVWRSFAPHVASLLVTGCTELAL